MKKAFAALLLGLFLLSATGARADGEVSLDVFYTSLQPYGQWLDVADYGYCFRPNAEASDPSWRPYADGYWAYTDAGWTWVAYEDFGWATYHYGRWTRLKDYGWVWVPGYEWGPAWVSWRTGGDYIGWAPLPPAVSFEIGNGIGAGVDVDFDIGPSFYNFCEVRYIGEPVLRGRLCDPRQNITIINNTVNVTNITYNNSVVHNGGPDYRTVSVSSARPIRQLALERRSEIDMNVGAVQPGAHSRVEGNRLVMTAPTFDKARTALPPVSLAAKVNRPVIDHGWAGLTDPREVAQVRQKLRSETPVRVSQPDGRNTPGRITPQAVALPKNPYAQMEQVPTGPTNPRRAVPFNAPVPARADVRNAVPEMSSLPPAMPPVRVRPVERPDRIAPVAPIPQTPVTAPQARTPMRRVPSDGQVPNQIP